MDGEVSKQDVKAWLALLNKPQLHDALNNSEKASLSSLCTWLEHSLLQPTGFGSSLLTPSNPAQPLTPTAAPWSPRKANILDCPQRPADCSGNGTKPCAKQRNEARKAQDDAEGGAACEDDIGAEIQKISSWETFDVFKVRELCQGNVLEFVTIAVFKRLGLIAKLNLDINALRSFLQEVEAGYNANPYHNSTHAADVVQSLSVLLVMDELHSELSDLELLALVVSAATHDVDHPGVTNDFLVKSKADAALVYNDISPNENTHISRAFHILSKPENNFLSVLPEPHFAVVRRLIIDIVLATDMAGHSRLMGNFIAAANMHGSSLSNWPASYRKYALMMLVHCADIGNPAKPLHVSLKWTERIMEESWTQGERERLLGLSVSPLCDKSVVHVPSMQLGFLQHFVKPSFEALELIAPSVAKNAMVHIASNAEYWGRLCETSGKQITKVRAASFYHTVPDEGENESA